MDPSKFLWHVHNAFWMCYPCVEYNWSPLINGIIVFDCIISYCCPDAFIFIEDVGHIKKCVFQLRVHCPTLTNFKGKQQIRLDKLLSICYYLFMLGKDVAIHLFNGFI